MNELNGIGVSPGIAIGKANVIRKNEAVATGILLKDEVEIRAAIERFDLAATLAINEIESISANTALSLTDDAMAILETHIELISDPQIRDDVVALINSDRKNEGDALIAVTQGMVELFENMEDEYLRARSADIQDISNRILRHLNNTGSGHSQKFETGAIIIAGDISPSDMITMTRDGIGGFAVQAGSKTSHMAIIARSQGVPAVVGCGVGLLDINEGDRVIVDGTTGQVLVNPGQETLTIFETKRELFLKRAEKLKQLKDIPSVTTDGAEITLMANIGSADDMDAVFDNGGEGVGLFRTELLFINRDNLPTEDEQFEFYKNAALKSKNKPVIIRTIDIGGDKQAPYFNLPAEQNPFLGYRAIRICLDREDIFITQLKAILRASVFGNLKVMFPMVSNIQELRAAKNIFGKAKNELANDHIAFNAAIETGVMIEIPSAAITADLLAPEVDFFSIGTNDLCQYTLAADRMNEKIAHLYDPFNPAVLRLITYVIEQGHKHGIAVGMCGEMAADPLATLLLLGMGLTDFSMSAAAIPAIKDIIIHSDLATAKKVREKAMQMDNSQNIKTYLQGLTQ